MLQRKLIDEQTYDLIDELRDLRNRVAHARVAEEEMAPELAERCGTIAGRTINRLRSKDKGLAIRLKLLCLRQRGTRMSEEKPKQTHLLTPYVFLDTQAFIGESFRWDGLHLTRLRSLANGGTIKLLTTAVTRREVQAQIGKKLSAAIEKLAAHRQHLVNAGVDFSAIDNFEVALQHSIFEFEQFLKECHVIDVPLSAKLEVLLDDYFKKAPPFSAQKPKEFPDAIVGASLTAWTASNGECRLYVVSADTDFQAYCATNPSLISVKTVAEVLTQANVSAELHAKLDELLRENEILEGLIAEALIERGISKASEGWHKRLEEGTITSAKLEEILEINVVESQPPKFSCEMKFIAELEVDVSLHAYTGEEMEYHDTSGTFYHDDSVDVEVCFDPEEPSRIGVRLSGMDDGPITIDLNELDAPHNHRRV